MDNYLVNIISSVFKEVYDKNKPYISNFLNTSEQELFIIESKKYPTLKLTFDGGMENAEYQKAVVSPVKMDIMADITVIKINYNPRYLSITHRNLLGSLIHLGISRNRIGDISLDEECAYVAVSSNLVEFIKENLTTINHQQVTISIAEDKITLQDKGVEKTIFLQSNRLDSVIALAYNISREDSLELIKREMVKLNQKVVIKSFQNLKPCDIISVAHKGRIKILDDSNTSRSGRIVMKIKIYR